MKQKETERNQKTSLFPSCDVSHDVCESDDTEGVVGGVDDVDAVDVGGGDGGHGVRERVVGRAADGGRLDGGVGAHGREEVRDRQQQRRAARAAHKVLQVAAARVRDDRARRVEHRDAADVLVVHQPERLDRRRRRAHRQHRRTPDAQLPKGDRRVSFQFLHLLGVWGLGLDC